MWSNGKTPVLHTGNYWFESNHTHLMPVQCVSCNREFDSSRAMSIHHKLTHGESIVKKEANCSIDDCNNTFLYYPSEKEGEICEDCVNEGKNIIHTDKVSIEDLQTITNNVDNNVDKIDVECESCGESNSVVPSRLSSDIYLCNRKCLDNYNSKRMSGNNNPRFKDGDSFSSNYDRNWRNVRKKALDRDDRSCCICGDSNNLVGHHLKPVRTFENKKDAHFVSNVITLCSSCHPKVEHGKIEISEKVIREKELVEPEIIF